LHQTLGLDAIKAITKQDDQIFIQPVWKNNGWIPIDWIEAGDEVLGAMLKQQCVLLKGIKLNGAKEAEGVSVPRTTLKKGIPNKKPAKKAKKVKV
jgi:hypothetical protein